MYQVLISNIINQFPENLKFKYLIPIKKPCVTTYMCDYNKPSSLTRIKEEILVICLGRKIVLKILQMSFNCFFLRKDPVKCPGCRQGYSVSSVSKCKIVPYRPDHPGYCIEGRIALQRIHENRHPLNH